MVSLLKDARYDAKLSGKKIIVSYPAYRQDILHAADVIEDLCISFGYNRIVPQKVELAVVGSELAETKSLELAREACVGLGLQEVLTFTMTAREKQQNQMLLPEQEFVELSNPVSLNWQVFRKSLIPELLEFLSKNKDVSYPQKIFEVGKTLEVDKSKPTGVKEPLKLCIAIASKETNFTDIKSHLEAACKALGISFETVSGSHPSFENGKVALVKMQNKKGIVGEVNKAVLQKFGLEVPVTVAEIEL
jgi:phenylalanyl-tRNA synthetase beta chain